MNEKKAGRTPIALRVLKELVLPLAGGVAYGAVVAQAKQMPLDGVTAGGVAFFCILAAQGLVLRAARTAQTEQAAAPACPRRRPSRPGCRRPTRSPPGSQPGTRPRAGRRSGEGTGEGARPCSLLVIEPAFERSPRPCR